MGRDRRLTLQREDIVVSTEFLVKLAENVVGAYLLSLVTLLLASGFNYLDVGADKAAALAAIPAALAVIKGFLAKLVGSPDSPSLVE
jgi:hypothetical protein